MTFLVGVTHPQGEDEEYDGMFLKESEFGSISSQLAGKPLLYNHDPETQIGTVISSWSGKGKNGATELFTLCELDNKTLDSNLAKYAISEGILKDFSLGHQVKLEQSANSRKVIEKTAVEVSVCEKGARNNTSIYAISFAPNKKYIKVNAKASSSISKMSEQQQIPVPSKIVETPVPVKEVETPVPVKEVETPEEVEEPVQLTHSVLMQLKKLQEENAALAQDLGKYQESGKRQREDVVKNGVQDYINGLVETNPELSQYKGEIDVLMKKMVESENGTPLVRMLQAAASKSSTSVVELEKAYQAKKASDEVVAKLRKDLELFKTDAFANPADRMMQSTISAVASKKPKTLHNKTNLNHDLFSQIDDALRQSRGNNSVPVHDPKVYNSKFSDFL